MDIPFVPEGMDPREAARLYASHGIYVGPLKGKNPGSILGSRWPEKTSITPSEIDRWFLPDAVTPDGIFIHCGRSGLVAVDVDDPSKAPEVVTGAGELMPPTLWTRYDGSRYTMIFADENGDFGNLKKDWGDVKAGNGAIVVPPSKHLRADQGGRYSWRHVGAVEHPPAALSAAIRRPVSEANVAAHGGELGTLIPHGTRDVTMTPYAYRLAHSNISYSEMRTLVLARWKDVEQPDGDRLEPEWALKKLETAIARRDQNRQRSEVEEWLPHDLNPYLDGTVKPVEPTVGIERTDGLRLIYPGKEHAIIGEMESGKSWMALACVAEEIKAGNAVVYLHFEEDNPGGSVERLQLMGISKDDLLKRFHFVTPQGGFSPTTWVALLDKVRPSLLVLDGVNEGMAMQGYQIKEAEGASAFRHAFAVPAKKLGAAVVSLDHVVKAQDGRGRYQYGSIHKSNALDGSSIVLVNDEPFGRGRRGRSSVYVAKDRPGYLRNAGKDSKGGKSAMTLMGTFFVDTTEGNSLLGLPVTGFLKPATHDDLRSFGGDEDEDELLEVVRGIVQRGVRATAREIRTCSPWGSKKTDQVRKRLVMLGRLIEKQDGTALVFTLPVVDLEATVTVPGRDSP
jgi:hypothetical protein